ncbi:hypothetical protein BH09ACT8_BH09ACT8_56410 [soil metagenome]
MSYPMNHPDAPVEPPPAAPGRAGLLERFSPASQAAISAVLLLVTVLIYFVSWQLPSPGSDIGITMLLLGFALVVDLYLIVVVALAARGRTARISAVIVAVIATCVDVGLCFAWDLGPDYATLYGIAYTGVLTAAVAAWGLARRQNWLWLIGPLPAIIVIGLAQIWFVPNNEISSWYLSWGINGGAFTLGCLFCWGIDRLARG